MRVLGCGSISAKVGETNEGHGRRSRPRSAKFEPWASARRPSGDADCAVLPTHAPKSATRHTPAVGAPIHTHAPHTCRTHAHCTHTATHAARTRAAPAKSDRNQRTGGAGHASAREEHGFVPGARGAEPHRDVKRGGAPRQGHQDCCTQTQPLHHRHGQNPSSSAQASYYRQLVISNLTDTAVAQPPRG